MCVMYRGCRVKDVSSLGMLVNVCTCVCVSLFTYVLVSHVPFFILIHLCSQISFCLSYLFSHPQLLSDTLSLCMKQGQMTISGNNITYLTISWSPPPGL